MLVVVPRLASCRRGHTHMIPWERFTPYESLSAGVGAKGASTRFPTSGRLRIIVSGLLPSRRRHTDPVPLIGLPPYKPWLARIRTEGESGRILTFRRVLVVRPLSLPRCRWDADMIRGVSQRRIRHDRLSPHKALIAGVWTKGATHWILSFTGVIILISYGCAIGSRDTDLIVAP